MSLLDHAKQELRAIGWMDSDDEMSRQMCLDVMSLMEVFANQGHSGFSASFCIETFYKLARYQPLTPLTGNNSEWFEPADGIWQNKRASHVFKDSDGRAYDIDAVFYTEPNGCSFTKGGARHYIEFPYTPTRKRVLVDFDGNEITPLKWDFLKSEYEAEQRNIDGAPSLPHVE